MKKNGLNIVALLDCLISLQKSRNKMTKETIPLKELISFEEFQKIFEKMMENEERRTEERFFPESEREFIP